MAGVYKKPSDRARGRAGKWTCWWFDEHGKRRKKAGYTDKGRSLELAQHLEAEARRVKEGIVDPGERTRREAGLKPVAAHVADYEASLFAKGDTSKHAHHAAGAIRRILDDASIASVAEIAPDRLQEALGRMRAGQPPKRGRSARTCNHALKSVQAFARWLYDAGRIKEVPRGLAKIPPYPEEADRRRVRRALTKAELDRLLAAAEEGPPVVAKRKGRGGRVIATITGPERAILYRIVMATGFRAEEVRTLTRERFELSGDSPSITVAACYSKRGKRSGRDDVQPIRKDVAAALAAWLEEANPEPGAPVLAVPVRTAEMLADDLARAGIPVKDDKDRVIDFHALRHSYITHLVASGINPKIVQVLARHSTITLTLDRYTHLEDEDVRGALEGKGTN